MIHGHEITTIPSLQKEQKYWGIIGNSIRLELDMRGCIQKLDFGTYEDERVLSIST